jgi:hypothetical protein
MFLLVHYNAAKLQNTDVTGIHSSKTLYKQNVCLSRLKFFFIKLRACFFEWRKIFFERLKIVSK